MAIYVERRDRAAIQTNARVLGPGRVVVIPAGATTVEQWVDGDTRMVAMITYRFKNEWWWDNGCGGGPHKSCGHITGPLTDPIDYLYN